MPIYVARINDGSCLIGEAGSASEARENFLVRWDPNGAFPEDAIISLREMPRNTFLSRWWPDEFPEDEGMLPGRLDGSVDDDCDVYEREYPMITQAHQRGFNEMANASSDKDIVNWDADLKDALTKAVRAEMRRGRTPGKNVQ